MGVSVCDTPLAVTSVYSRVVGSKNYELTDHLGNVRAVVGDIKLPSGMNFTADLKSSSDYYPFGMAIPARGYQSADYRYGYNGKEKDDEVKGDGVQYDYGFRIYDSRLAKFLSVDPLTKDYPMLTPYQFASNTPIWGKDLDGLEVLIYTEGNQGMSTGHTFISIGSGKDLTVFSYGRYDNVDNENSKGLFRLRATSTGGEGVMIKYVGDQAFSFISDYIKKYDTEVFALTDITSANEKKVLSNLESQWSSSSELPDRPDGKYYNNPSAHVVDRYSLSDNNCCTKVCDAAKEGSTNAFIIRRSIVSTQGEVHELPSIQVSPLSPKSTQSFLEMQSKNKESGVVKVTNSVLQIIQTPSSSENPTVNYDNRGIPDKTVNRVVQPGQEP